MSNYYGSAANMESRRRAQRKYRKQHPDKIKISYSKYLPRQRVVRKNRYETRRRWMQDIKTAVGCQLCGELDHRCLDFHHVDPKLKSFTISHRTMLSKAKLQAEINKCVVLCSNCHRKLENFNDTFGGT